MSRTLGVASRGARRAAEAGLSSWWPAPPPLPPLPDSALPATRMLDAMLRYATPGPLAIPADRVWFRTREGQMVRFDEMSEEDMDLFREGLRRLTLSQEEAERASFAERHASGMLYLERQLSVAVLGRSLTEGMDGGWLSAAAAHQRFTREYLKGSFLRADQGQS